MKREFVRKLRGIAIGVVVPVCVVTANMQGALMVYADEPETAAASENIDKESQEQENTDSEGSGHLELGQLPEIGGGTVTPDENQPSGDQPSEDQPSGDTPSEDVPSGDLPSGDVPSGEIPPEGQPSEDQPSQDMPDIGHQPEEEAPPAEQPEAEQPPAEEIPAEEVPEEAPAEEESVLAGISDFIPSLPFIDNGEKIKYNVSVPIEGLPSFITQEMIIGALKCQDQTGYPASVTIAQIIQESGFGKYGPGGEEGQGLSYLANQYNNLFGIKGEGPAGSVNMGTGEQTAAGTSYRITAGFRVYNTYTESLEDRTSLLQRVYGDLIEGVTDANTFAMRIGGRWATDIDYGQSLIWQMEKYDLYRLDSMTVGEFSDMIGTFANPCPGAIITSSFGFRTFDNSFHKGLDLGTSGENIPTYAAAAGTVVNAGWSDSAGNWVVIDHGNGLVTKYMHHEAIFVEEGQQVEKGQQIGITGTTGYSTGVHLHFQVEENGTAVDPLTYLINQDIQGQQ